METIYYLDKFKKSVEQFDRQLFIGKNLEYKVGIWLESVVLKIQKKSWINTSQTAKPFEESIFFSVWLNDESVGKSKLHYNIHALKLRQLTDYSIKSREFADAFRLRFKTFEKEWPNVSVNYGPLTLMEGWITIDEEKLEGIILDLAHKFSEIAFIIDDLLAERRKTSLRV
jgi:hypothetical protein